MRNPFPRFPSWPPDYTAVFAWRQQQLIAMRRNPVLLMGAREYYKTHRAEFIEHWTDTVDPRNAGKPDKLVRMPFVMFPKQRELIQFLTACLQLEVNGLIEKCRDMGATWDCVGFSVHLWLFQEGTAVGWGSRKEDLVDKLGDMSSIFEKIRSMINGLPPEFLPRGFNPKDHMTYMKCINPENGSTIIGETGDNIGRGGRTTIYFKDEAQPLSARILTPSGWSTMDDMRIGSIVIGPDGASRLVVGVNDAGWHPTYRVTFSDGTSTECSHNHKWTVEHVWGKRKTSVMRMHEIAENVVYRSPGGQTQYRYRIPTTAPVHFVGVGPLPLDPYIVGVLIGDGSIKHVPKYRPSFTSIDPQIVEEVARLLPDTCRVVSAKDGLQHRLGDKEGRRGQGKISRASQAIMDAGIAGFGAENKHIPQQYLFASPADRLALLQGLMDTDGSASGGVASYHTCSARLADDVRFLVQSLGGTATLNVKPDHRGYRDMYVLHLSLTKVFRLQRKIDKLKVRKHPTGRTIVSVEYVGEKVVRCITVAAEDGLYLTDNCIVTHNSAHYLRPEKIQAALDDNTRVQIDISSVNGIGNVFYNKRHAKNAVEYHPAIPIAPNKTSIFIMDWRDHPEKDEAWYNARRQKAIDEGLLHLFKQEVDRDYAGSVTGVIIDPMWVKAAIDAHLPRKRAGMADWAGFDDEGPRVGALDVADEGGDLNALAIRKGPILKHAEAWGEGDTGLTARRAVTTAAKFGAMDLQYDSVGVGAGVKAETNRLVTDKVMPPGIRMVPWSAGAKVLHPESRLIRGDAQSPFNKDYFQNLKVQAWFQLARRFERTYRAVVEGINYDPGELISLPSTLANLRQIEKELSQATQGLSTLTLKMIVNKTPEGTRSPNIADSIVMAFWPVNALAFKYGKNIVG